MGEKEQNELIRLKMLLWKFAIKLGWIPRRHNFLARKNEKGKLIRLSFRMDDVVRLQEKVPLSKKEVEEGKIGPNWKLLKEVEYGSVEIKEYTIDSTKKKKKGDD